VLDVKYGRGAFMQQEQEARRLAETLVRIGTYFGKETMAFLTDMNQPLGIAIGNWLEVVESMECLLGRRGEEDASNDLMNLAHALAGAMLMLGKRASSIEEGEEMSREAIRSGAAYRKFLELVEMQGGDVGAIENLENYPLSKHTIDVRIGEGGFITAIDPLELGFAAIMLGAGRQKVDDRIDPKAGILLRKKEGDRVEDHEVVATFFTDREDIIDAARSRIANSFQVGTTPSAQRPLIHSLIDKAGARPWR